MILRETAQEELPRDGSAGLWAFAADVQKHRETWASPERVVDVVALRPVRALGRWHEVIDDLFVKPKGLWRRWRQPAFASGRRTKRGDEGAAAL